MLQGRYLPWNYGRYVKYLPSTEYLSLSKVTPQYFSGIFWWGSYSSGGSNEPTVIVTARQQVTSLSLSSYPQVTDRHSEYTVHPLSHLISISFDQDG